MKLHNLERSTGFKEKARKIGRGNATKGNTSGKGNKGQKARSGGSISPFFEGGQTPLIQKMPKFKGFKRADKLRTVYSVLNLFDLEKNPAITSEVTKDILISTGYIKKSSENVKILGNGTLTKKLVFSGIEKFSQSAMDKITKVGGEIK